MLRFRSCCRAVVLIARQENRKICFLAHSLGGLVVKQALCLSHSSEQRHIQQVGNSIASIIFLGTPHFGAELAAWGVLGAKLAKAVTRPAKNIVHVLKPDSEVLAAIQNGFHNLLRLRRDEGLEIFITCFYEELPFPLVGEVCLPILLGP